jgi:hypothetical protein
MSRGIIVSLCALAAILAASDRANSTGAIAEGIAPGGVARGYSYAINGNSANADAAGASALAACKKGPEQLASGSRPDANFAKAQARCAVVTTFTNKCAATALDPKDGTPGAGWAIGDTQKQADDEALARCRSTAGADRRDFCKVITQKCDGTAK